MRSFLRVHNCAKRDRDQASPNTAASPQTPPRPPRGGHHEPHRIATRGTSSSPLASRPHQESPAWPPKAAFSWSPLSEPCPWEPNKGRERTRGAPRTEEEAPIKAQRCWKGQGKWAQKSCFREEHFNCTFIKVK